MHNAHAPALPLHAAAVPRDRYAEPARPVARESCSTDSSLSYGPTRLMAVIFDRYAARRRAGLETAAPRQAVRGDEGASRRGGHQVQHQSSVQPVKLCAFHMRTTTAQTGSRWRAVLRCHVCREFICFEWPRCGRGLLDRRGRGGATVCSAATDVNMSRCRGSAARHSRHIALRLDSAARGDAPQIYSPAGARLFSVLLPLAHRHICPYASSATRERSRCILNSSSFKLRSLLHNVFII